MVLHQTHLGGASLLPPLVRSPYLRTRDDPVQLALVLGLICFNTRVLVVLFASLLGSIGSIQLSSKNEDDCPHWQHSLGTYTLVQYLITKMYH